MLAPNDAFAHEVANHLMEEDTDVVIVEWTRGKSDYHLLPTLGRSGMTFEVGACPWGGLRLPGNPQTYPRFSLGTPAPAQPLGTFTKFPDACLMFRSFLDSLENGKERV